jgi:protein disulfide-isomerase A1
MIGKVINRMKGLILAVALFGLIAAEAGKWGVEEQDDVAVLTKDNFNDFIKNNKFAFVKFYAPWCGHCKSMAAGYSKLAKRMKSETNGVAIAKVDTTVETTLGEQFGIKGYPTLKFFVDGQPVDYSGAREEDALYNWIMKKTGPSTSELKTTAELTDLQNKKIAVLLATTEDNETLLKAFNAVAASVDDITFHYTFSPEVKQALDIADENAFVLLRNFDDGTKIMTGDYLTTESMKDFLNVHKHPLVMPFEQEAAERIFGSESPAIFVFSDQDNTDAIKTFKTVAQKFAGTGLVFSHSTITTGLGARLAEFLGITAKDANSVRIIKFAAGNLLKYKLDTVTEDSLTQFINDWKNEKLTAYFKSENIPESNNEPVKVIVGNSFEDMVINNDKYVLLEAYAPWCGHCKQLEPIYTELATKLAGVTDIVIAKMDSTANEHPSLNIKGFPTIKFYKKGDKSNPMDYNGERTVDGFIAFLEKEVGRKLTGSDAPIDESL